MIFGSREWDSDFFGFSIGDLTVEESDVVSEIHSFLGGSVSRAYRCIYVTSKNLDQIQGVNSLQSGAHTLFERRVYEKKLSKSEKQPTEISLLSSNDNRDDLYSLALASGHASRFVQDQRFSTHAARYFRAWIDNSINGSMADCIFVTRNSGRVIGFITVSTNKGYAQVGLIAVDQSFRRNGIGRQLLRAAENFAFSAGKETLRIPTQGNNDVATSFYEREGYSCIQKEYTIHVWHT